MCHALATPIPGLAQGEKVTIRYVMTIWRREFDTPDLVLHFLQTWVKSWWNHGEIRHQEDSGLWINMCVCACVCENRLFPSDPHCYLAALQILSDFLVPNNKTMLLQNSDGTSWRNQRNRVLLFVLATRMAPWCERRSEMSLRWARGKNSQKLSNQQLLETVERWVGILEDLQSPSPSPLVRWGLFQERSIGRRGSGSACLIRWLGWN